jgi:ribulose-5-phosphate 4-epimerase/fuculose-1-phosphate aldolase
MNDLRSRVAQACRVLAHLGLTSANYGHVSARIPGAERALIRARGPGELGVRYTEADQVVEVDFEGRLVEENERGLAVPIEVFIHTELYRARPDVHSVIHVHPETVVVFTVTDAPLLPLAGAFDTYGLDLIFEGIPTFNSSVLIDSPRRGEKLARTMKDRSTCMMRGHGITSAAGSIEQAALAAIALNNLARLNYRARLLGKPKPISKSDQQEFRKLHGPREITNGAPPTGRLAALWRYYCTVTERGEAPAG